MDTNFLTISNREKVCSIPFTEIMYVKSSGMCSSVHTINGSRHSCSKNLGAIEKELHQGKTFFRVHTSFLVNIARVKEYLKKDGGVIVMTDGSMIVPSKRRKSGFLQVYRDKSSRFSV